jgi:hypothetical protein
MEDDLKKNEKKNEDDINFFLSRSSLIKGQTFPGIGSALYDFYSNVTANYFIVNCTDQSLLEPMKLTPMGVISPSLAKEINKPTWVIFDMLQN